MTTASHSAEAVIRRYLADGTVFRSPDRSRGANYRIGDLDETGFEVIRLDANKPERCTYA